MWDKYEQIYDAIGWPSPAMVATLVDCCGLNKDTTEIFECGVGTGLLGKELNLRGFKNISGFDGCQEMVDWKRILQRTLLVVRHNT